MPGDPHLAMSLDLVAADVAETSHELVVRPPRRHHEPRDRLLTTREPFKTFDPTPPSAKSPTLDNFWVF